MHFQGPPLAVQHLHSPNLKPRDVTTPHSKNKILQRKLILVLEPAAYNRANSSRARFSAHAGRIARSPVESRKGTILSWNQKTNATSDDNGMVVDKSPLRSLTLKAGSDELSASDPSDFRE